jgi:aminocarboxymuconate-semialdehyde decarboxylase
MQDPGLAIKELERCTHRLGMPGVQIGTNVNGKNLDDPAVVEVLAAAESLGACVFVHPWDMLGGERMARHWFPWLVGMPAETSLAVASVCFGGVMERLPRLRIAFAHGGGAAPMTLGRWDHGFRERPDLCQTATTVMPSEAFRRLWFDSLVHDAEALRLLLSVAGPGKVALGTDYPFPLGELAPGAVVRAASWLDDATRASILHGAAAAFLGPRAAHATGAASTAAPPHVNAIR